MSFDRALFGPAGNSISFAEMGYRNSLDTPKYLEKMGLDWFEYQCGRGVNIGAETCRKFGEVMKAANKGVSLHAPYYIFGELYFKERRGGKRHGRRPNRGSSRRARRPFERRRNGSCL